MALSVTYSLCISIVAACSTQNYSGKTTSLILHPLRRAWMHQQMVLKKVKKLFCPPMVSVESIRIRVVLFPFVSVSDRYCNSLFLRSKKEGETLRVWEVIETMTREYWIRSNQWSTTRYGQKELDIQTNKSQANTRTDNLDKKREEKFMTWVTEEQTNDSFRFENNRMGTRQKRTWTQ